MIPGHRAGRFRGLTIADLVESAQTGSRRILSWLAGFLGGSRDPALHNGRELGALGERMAVRRLRRNGYRIIARNFRAAGAEIDVIALDGDVLVFVEVKTRLRTGAGRPEEAVDARKQYRIHRAAEIFADRRRMNRRTMRFDVVAVSRPASRWEFEIFKDAF